MTGAPVSAYVSSFRMYNATPEIVIAWRALFTQVFQETGLDVAVIDHGWPEPIESLWNRADLCCAFMCGWPFHRAGAAVQAIAAPVPALAKYEGRARYRSEFLVRERESADSIEAMFGRRFGFMTDNSQSGFNAPRRVLAAYAKARGGALFAEVAPPLHTPARALAAVRDGLIDVTAIDSFYLDLLRHRRSDALAHLRTLAVTPWTPIPLLVAAHAVPQAVVDRLQAKLCGLHLESSYRPLLGSVMLERFIEPDLDSYAVFASMASESEQLGYHVIA